MLVQHGFHQIWGKKISKYLKLVDSSLKKLRTTGSLEKMKKGEVKTITATLPLNVE